METNDFLNPMLQAVLVTLIEVLLPVLLGLFVRFTLEEIQRVKAAKHSQEFELVKQIVQRLVRAAEQSGLNNVIANVGEEKKRYVIDLAEAELQRRGIKVDLDILDALVEAEVHESLTQVKEELETLFDLNNAPQPA